MNVQKYTKEACGHLFAHFERSKDENGEYIKFGNRSISSKRTEANFNLAPTRNMTQLEYLDKRLSEVYHMKKKGLNVMCSWVVTVPEDLPAERNLDFFIAAYEFLSKRYGKENVISSYVHRDEDLNKGHEHMHFSFIPVVYDKKKERYKVSAKEVISRKELQSIHKEIQDYVSKELGIEVHMLNGKTVVNKSIKELKACNDKIKETNREIIELSEKKKNVIKDVERKKYEYQMLMEKCNNVYKRGRDGIEIPDTIKRKHIFGEKRVEMDEADWNRCLSDMLDMSETVQCMGLELDKAKENINELKEIADRDLIIEQRHSALMKKYAELDARHRKLSERFANFIKIVLEVIPGADILIERWLQKSMEAEYEKKEEMITR